MEEQVARKRLQELLTELDASVAVMQRAADDSAEPGDQHPADSGSNLVAADREEASLEVMLGQRDRVQAALARLDTGTYGKCIDCEAELPDERLDARPEAERCVRCQQRAESAR